MPSLTDPIILAQFQSVLVNWSFTGYVTAKDTALEWIADHLSGMKLKDVAKVMNDFVAGGGAIDQQPERRPEWSAWSFHYDFRLALAGRDVYRAISKSCG